jgi:DUF4097 and DUF4098 domain-containing protein YvlB
VAADRGSVAVQASENNEVGIEVRRKLQKVSAADARLIFQNHEVTFSQQDKQVRVTAQFKTKPARGAKDHQLQVSYRITVPKTFSVDLQTRAGAIQVGDLKGNVKADTAAGAIKIGGIEGPVQARTSGGSVSVASAETAMLHTSAGKIDVGEIGGSLECNTSGGAIRVQSAQGKVVAKTSAGGIEIIHAKAEISAQTSGGSIEVGKGEAGASVKTSAGSIKIGEIAGDLIAETHGGSIKVQKCGGKLIAKTSAGNIDVGNAVNSLHLSTSGGSIQANVVGALKVDSSVETSAGNIKLALPENTALNIDAKASGGQVSCDLPVAPLKQDGKAKKTALSGKLNGGGPLLTLRTGGGSISLKKQAALTAERE